VDSLGDLSTQSVREDSRNPEIGGAIVQCCGAVTQHKAALNLTFEVRIRIHFDDDANVIEKPVGPVAFVA